MRKTLAITALTLLLSQQSLAKGFYIGGKYHSQFASNTGSLEVKNSSGNSITAAKVNDRIGENTEEQSISKYKPNYNPPFSASIVLGSVKQLEQHECRFELEGTYSRVKINNIGLINGPIVITYDMKEPQKKTTAAVNGNQPIAQSIAKDNSSSIPNIESTKTQDATYAVIANHNQIENSSVMANVYHHWKNDQFSFSPYAGAGIGVTRIKMFEKSSIRPAYQLKAGINYQVNKDTDIYIGYRHFGVIGGNFGKFETLKSKTTEQGVRRITSFEKDESVTTIKNSFFSTHSVEVGMIVRFAS